MAFSSDPHDGPKHDPASMTKRNGALIVGIDSLIGRHLSAFLSKEGWDVAGTTRRRESADGIRRIHLDLAAERPEIDAPGNIAIAVFCAAASGYAQCEADPASERVNVINAARIAEQLTRRGIYTVFLSTNAVFSGNRPMCDERDPPDATTKYGKQKAEAERLMLGNLDAERRHLLAVLRLTKVTSWDTPTFARWQVDWAAGRVVRPFSDLLFSPITLDYVNDAIGRLAVRRPGGIFHLSGAADISYAEFARLLATGLGLDAGASVIPATSTEAGVSLANSPAYPTMAMPATTLALDLAPQPASAVANSMSLSLK